MRFKQFMEAREIELYHGTTTGEDDHRIASFQQGIKKRSTGYGQDPGYYTFSDKEMAANHARSLVGTNSPKTFQNHQGKPMVVAHKAQLNPRDYELDKEIQSQDLLRFLKASENKINNFLSSNPITVDPGEGGTTISSMELHGFFYHPKWNSVGFWLVNPNSPEFDLSQAKEDVHFISVNPRNVHEATDLHYILKALFTASPDLQKDYMRFMRSIMKRTGEGRAQPRAWKYIGDKPLTPSQITTL